MLSNCTARALPEADICVPLPLALRQCCVSPGWGSPSVNAGRSHRIRILDIRAHSSRKMGHSEGQLGAVCLSGVSFHRSIVFCVRERVMTVASQSVLRAAGAHVPKFIPCQDFLRGLTFTLRALVTHCIRHMVLVGSIPVPVQPTVQPGISQLR